ncbi:hypothetical protein EDB86DRAFT_2876672 [Lactarius hatsudake]|nr:hypothetical protein EDB86DRAFT_2876672 [Lactarius hatsudake]
MHNRRSSASELSINLLPLKSTLFSVISQLLSTVPTSYPFEFPPVTRTVLPALTSFEFYATVSQPRSTAPNVPTCSFSQLFKFVNRSEDLSWIDVSFPPHRDLVFARIQPVLPSSSPTFAISSVCVVQLQDGKTCNSVHSPRCTRWVQTLYAGAGQSTLPLPSKTLPERRSLNCYQPLTCSARRDQCPPLPSLVLPVGSLVPSGVFDQKPECRT